MKAMRYMKAIYFVISALLVIAASLPVPAHAADMTDYCVIPSYVRTGANPNIVILLDNDENNAGPAYTGANTGSIDTPTGLTLYDASREYFGIFRSKVWYSYSTNKFYPDVNGVFDGNMLNWALTSGYDMIESIVVGGKSSARVGEKVKSLKGESSGTWESKIYLYTGTDGASYACEVVVSGGNAKFKENSYYNSTLGRKCGLIVNNGGTARYPASPLVRPASGSAYTKVAALVPEDATMYAAASVRTGDAVAAPSSPLGEFEPMYAASGVMGLRDDSLLARGMDLVNSIVGRFAGVAVAAKPTCQTSTLTVVSPGTAFANATVDTPYTYTMSAAGGDGNYSWSLAGEPAWLVYNATTGQITGTPTAISNTTITVTVTDTCTPTNTTPVDRTLQVVLPASLTPIVINSPMNDGDYVTQGTQGSIYNGYIAVASGGQTPYTWSATNLATYGLSIDSPTGLISGVPTIAAGTYGFTLTVTDKYSQLASRAANIKIINTTTAAGGLAITSITSVGGNYYSDVNVGWYLKAGVPKQYFYSGVREIAQGGKTPYTWSATGLQNGLSINPATGLINGTPLDPSACGASICGMTVRVTDSLGATASVNRSFYYNFGAINGTSTDPTDIYSLISWFSGATLPAGQQGKDYPGWSAMAYGGAYSFFWTATGLPSGLQIESNTGLIYGKPTGKSGAYSPNVCVTDDLGVQRCSTLSLTIGTLLGVPAITGPTAWSAYQGEPMVPIQFSASGGVGPYTWSAIQNSGAALPGSLNIGATTGYFSGAPPTSASSPLDYYITVKATDVYGEIATLYLKLTTVTKPWSGLESWDLSIVSCPAVDPDGPANSDGAGDYYNNPYKYNCSNFPPDSVLESTNPVRSGLIQDYVSKARFGLIDFATSTGEVTGNEDCVEQYSKDQPAALSSFFTEVENAVPTSTVTKLSNGLYKTVNYFLFNTVDPGKNPFYDSASPYARKASCDSPYDIPCRKNFALLLTGGAGAEQGTKVFDTATNLAVGHKCRTIDAAFSSKNIVVNACVGANTDVNEVTPAGTERVLTYAVNVSALAETYFIGTTPTSAGILNAASKTYGGGKYYAVKDPSKLREQLANAFDDMIKRAASGTAASVLASGEGSGANLIQAVYYPGKEFYNPTTDSDDTVFWLGRLSNFWYYVDPFFLASSIREDTIEDSALNLLSDYVVNLYYNAANERVEATRSQDTDGNGTPDVSIGIKPFEEVSALWEAGALLWERDVTNPATDRTFLVHFSNTTNALAVVNSSNAAATASVAEVRRLLQAADVTEATNILKFTLGHEITGYRNRTVYLDTDGDGTYEGPHVWKLGDVVDSTPRILSHLPINNYDVSTSQGGYNDSTYKEYVASATYTDRGYVFAGGNDGLLHAFYLGLLNTSADQGDNVATLSGTDKGKEVWSFIPRNALPYLKYAADENYCHVFTIDLSPYLLDASVASSGVGADCSQSEYWKCERTKDSWRTVLIGGMRLGGACRETSASCTDCVKTPLEDAGYSSYFALDVTDPMSPQLLWEFDAQGQVGMTSSGPTALRIGYKPDGDTSGDGKVNGLDGKGEAYNGRWYAVFGSGPTGPIDTDQRQFLGKSDQTPKLFVLDLYSGTLLKTLTPTTAIAEGFIGSIIDTSNDSDMDYQDDAFYVGYTYKDTSVTPNTFTKGGVGRILTWEDMDPNNWKWTTLIDGLGAVTSSVVHLQNNSENKLWVYFASGRYFYKTTAGIDDSTTRQALYGVKDPCYSAGAISFNEACDDTYKLSVADLEDKTTICTLSPPTNGWFINLEGDEDNVDVILDDGTVATYDFGAERVITDPLASTIGVVYFTSFRPYSDQCDIGGRSYIWAVDYESGGDASARLKGVAIVQVSTGAIEQIDLTSVFGDGACDGTASDTFGIAAAPPVIGPDGQPTGTGDPRKSASLEGVPPVAQGLSIISQPPPTPRVLHIRER